MSDDRPKQFVEYSDDEWEDLLKRVRERSQKEGKEFYRAWQLFFTKLSAFYSQGGGEGAPSTRIPAKRRAKNKRDQEIRDILCEALDILNVSEETIMTKEISEIAQRFPHHEQVMKLFEQEYKLRYGDLPAEKVMIVSDFVPHPRTLRNWRKAYQNRSTKFQ